MAEVSAALDALWDSEEQKKTDPRHKFERRYPGLCFDGSLAAIIDQEYRNLSQLENDFLEADSREQAGIRAEANLHSYNVTLFHRFYGEVSGKTVAGRSYEEAIDNAHAILRDSELSQPPSQRREAHLEFIDLLAESYLGDAGLHFTDQSRQD